MDVRVVMRGMLVTLCASVGLVPVAASEEIIPGPILVETPDLQLQVTTSDHTPGGLPEYAEVMTASGLITAEFSYYSWGHVAHVAGHEGSVILQYTHTPDTPIASRVKAVVPGVGSAVWDLDQDGVPTLAMGTITDLDNYVDSEFYSGIEEAAPRLFTLLGQLDDSEPQRPNLSIIGAADAFALALAVPRQLGDEDEGYSPAHGLCVLNSGYAACQQCCSEMEQNSANVSDWMYMMGVPVTQVTGPVGGLNWGALGFLIGTGAQGCVEQVCEGKPGDPSPETCGADGQGFCSFACPQGGGMAGTCANSHHYCCPATLSECPSPWDPDCGECNFAPDNFCCLYPESAACEATGCPPAYIPCCDDNCCCLEGYEDEVECNADCSE